MSFLKGKTAIITGAGYSVLSNGKCGAIGYGIATAYAKEGANLVITGRNVAKLEKAGLRVELDNRNEKIGYRIREAKMSKIPYMLVIGEKEQTEGTVTARNRKDESVTMPLDEFVAKAVNEVNEKVR